MPDVIREQEVGQPRAAERGAELGGRAGETTQAGGGKPRTLSLLQLPRRGPDGFNEGCRQGGIWGEQQGLLWSQTEMWGNEGRLGAPQGPVEHQGEWGQCSRRPGARWGEGD